MKFSRTFAMPNHETFSIKEIGIFVHKYISNSKSSIDPFARNNNWTTYTNDIDPKTTAKSHMGAEEFCKQFDVIEEILLINHGGAHNDTICMAERKISRVNS